MGKTVIVTGGNINKDFIKEYIRTFSTIIAVDGGLKILDELNIMPNYIIGDFDTIDTEILDKYKEKTKTYTLNSKKDFTDTHMALKLAIGEGETDIEILGAIGTRIDHTIANIHILKEALTNNVRCKIVDEKNIIYLINKKEKIEKDDNYKYISLIPLTTKVEGIFSEGLLYPLKNTTLTIGESIGISNEQILSIAEIEIKKEGILILIKSKD